MKFFLLLLGTAVFFAGGSSVGAEAQEPVQYTAGVAAGPLTLLADVSPGGVWNGSFKMYGQEGGPVSVFDLEVADLGQTSSGSKMSVERGQGSRSAADWIDVASEVRVAGGEQREIPVTVSIPGNAYGVYSAFISIKLRPEEPGAQMAAVVVPVIDVEVLVMVRGTGPLELRTERVELGSAANGGQRVMAEIVNTGVWICKVRGDLLFYPESGGFPERIELPMRRDGRPYEVYPGQKLILNCEFGRAISPGRYSAVSRLDLGDRRESRSQFDLTVGGAGGSAQLSDGGIELGTELVIDDPIREIRLPAGGQRSVAIRLRNTGDEPIALGVATHDARLESDGRWTYAATAMEHPEFTVEVSLDSLVIEPQSSTTLKATVSAKKDAQLSSTVIKGVRFTGSASGQSGNGRTVYDTGALIVIEPVGAGTASLEVSDLELVRMIPDRNPGSVVLTVANFGEGVGEVQGSVKLTRDSGELVAELIIGAQRWERIMPGGHRKFRMSLPIVDEGTFVLTAELSQKGRPDVLRAETSFISTESFPEGLR
jgi:hypothetical protein